MTPFCECKYGENEKSALLATAALCKAEGRKWPTYRWAADEDAGAASNSQPHSSVTTSRNISQWFTRTRNLPLHPALNQPCHPSSKTHCCDKPYRHHHCILIHRHSLSQSLVLTLSRLMFHVGPETGVCTSRTNMTRCRFRLLFRELHQSGTNKHGRAAEHASRIQLDASPPPADAAYRIPHWQMRSHPLSVITDTVRCY